MAAVIFEEPDAVDKQRRGSTNQSGNAHKTSKRRHGQEDDSDPESPLAKRQRIAALLDPTSAPVPARLSLVAARVSLFSKESDITSAVRSITTSLSAPGFPPRLWKPILLDHYIDFTLVLTLANPEPQAVTNAAQWNYAFCIYSDAVLFVFPWRGNELRTYQRHVNNLFAIPGLQGQGHHDDNSESRAFCQRVLRYDRAARVRIGQTGSLLLDDVTGDSFMHLRDAYLSSTGIYAYVAPVSDRQPMAKRTQRQRQKQRRAKTCKKYNRGTCTRAHCRFRHVCFECTGPHLVADCHRSNA
ncbi:hypothetical protein C8F01DRAFT_1070825 [Mycena amicta]|nr:hypothetical protein C8F01DRAFT_1070825 [Mycena amicta]